MADVVAAADATEVAEVTLRGCRHGLSASASAVWLLDDADDTAPVLLSVDGAKSSPPGQDRRRSAGPEIDCAGDADGPMSCLVSAETGPDSGHTVLLEVSFGVDDYPGRMRREALSMLATVAASAIGQLRASGNSRRIALALQRQLLPQIETVPNGEAAVRYLPADEGARVGGDWYDIVQTRDDRTVLVLGDVVGHSIESAVQMREISTALRSHLIEGLPASLALARVNDLALDRAGFATCCCVEIRNHGVVITSAGHPPPVRVNAHGGASAYDVRPGPPLGAMPGSAYPGQRGELDADDAIVLYSDGLVETRTNSITDGIDRLRRAAANAHPEDLEALVTHLLGLTTPLHRLHDDIAILAFRPNHHATVLTDDRASRVPTGQLPIDSELVWRLIDAAPDAIILIASNGEIVLANQRTEDIFGHSRSELIGQPVEVLLPVGQAEAHSRLRSRYTADPSVRPMGEGARFDGRHQDGTTVGVNVSLSPMDLDGATYIMATVRAVNRDK